jgi:hypothetical protein
MQKVLVSNHESGLNPTLGAHGTAAMILSGSAVQVKGFG